MMRSPYNSQFEFGGSSFAYGVTEHIACWRGVRVLLPVLATLFLFAGMSINVVAANVTLDYTFGIGGSVRTDMSGGGDGISDMVIQPDGKIVAIGGANGGTPRFGVARYNPDGSLDSAFGTGGKVTTIIPGQFGGYGQPLAVALQADDKIVVVGTAYISSATSARDYVLVRYNANGSIDSSFGPNGMVFTDFAGNADYASDVLIQPDGKIIAIGRSYFINSEQYFDFSLARYNSDGSLDSSFGTGGKATANFGYGDEGYCGVLLADGKILVGGTSRNVGTLDDVAVVRFNSNGSVDTSFGIGGRQTVDFFFDYDETNAIAVQPDGKIVVVGYTWSSQSAFWMTVARFNADGSVDSGFGVGGKQLISLVNGSNALASEVAIQPDGKIVIAGYTSVPDPNAPIPNDFEDFAFVRLNTDGSLDTSFDGDGKFHTRLLPGDFRDRAHALLLLPGGKILVGGYARIESGSSDFAIARFLTIPRPVTPYDFDGDGKADLGVFRPTNGSWYVRFSSNGFLSGVQWGTAGDQPDPADFDGDSRSDFVIFRNGLWYIVYTATMTTSGNQFGTTGDIPVAADYDGDGRADLAVFRPSNGSWYILRSSDHVVQGFQLGANEDKPVPGDYNGDGKADVAVWRPSTGTWYTSTSPINNFDAFVWGQSGDIAVPGDYDGDGKNDRAIFRPSTTKWWIYYSSNGGYLEQQFGASTDQPVPADYDGDGRTNIAVFRPSTGYWYTSLDVGTNYGATLWGQAGDIAIESSNVP